MLKLEFKFDKLLNTKYGSKKAEWPYWHIKPKVFIEEYLVDQFAELVDYKVFCFNGEPKIINVCMQGGLLTSTKDCFLIRSGN